jgi:hypothetical protein
MATKINTRSPFFIKVQPSIGGINKVSASLYIYDGVKETDKPTSAQYTIEKFPLSGNDFVSFEISELVRDYLDINFNQERTEDAYIERIELDGGVFEQNSLLTNFSLDLDDDYSSGTSWVEVDFLVTKDVTGTSTTESSFNLIDSGASFSTTVAVGDTIFNTTDSTSAKITEIVSDTQVVLDADIMDLDESYEVRANYYNDYIAFDGYGYFEDGANPELSRTLLQSNTDIYYLEGESLQVPVFSEEVTSVKFYNNGSLHTTRTISSSDNSSLQISYPSSISTTDKIEVISASGTETINVYPTQECKYTPHKITFVNKFGALQNIYFFKKSTESLNTTDSTFKSNTFNEFDLRYDLQKHQYKTFQKTGRENVSMNTGFVSEEYNSVIKELLLSEQVWITKDNEILPINVKTKSLSYKTSVNDKLIDYTIEFDFAFDKVNNIR